MGPRGIGTIASMMLVGRVDTRLLLGIGLGLTAWSFYAKTGWTPNVSQSEIVVVGVFCFMFVPLSSATLATVAAGSAD